MLYLFGFCFFLAFYHLFLYGFLLTVFPKRKFIKVNEDYIPSITILCPAYNEEKDIAAKIESFLALDYPQNHMKFIVISDDSTDNTNAIVENYAQKRNNIQLLIQKSRRGKPSALNFAESFIESDLVVLTDANSLFQKQTLRKLVASFANKRVGLVSGSLRLRKVGSNESGEGLYWRYESWLKKMDSAFYSIVGANGSLFAIRKALFGQIHPSSPDDFERTLITLQKRFLALYEPNAIVEEESSTHNTQEINRKIRIISREWFALFRHAELLNPFKHFRVAFMLISHKLIRWLLPFISGGLLISNIFLLEMPIFQAILGLQIVGYLLGTLGLLLEKQGKNLRLLKIPAYFLAMNIASLFGFIKFLRGQQQATWNTIREEETS